MTDEVKFGLSDLDVSDDLDVSLDNDTYQDQSSPAPVAAGDYLLRLLADSIRPSTLRGGDNKGLPRSKKIDGKEYPILSIGVVEIVDGLGEGNTRKVGLFQDVNTNPYERDGKTVSQIGDFARALGLPNYTGLGQALPLFEEAQQNGATFGASLDWESAFDKEFVEAALKQLGLAGIERSDMTDAQRKLANAIQYRYAVVQGMKHFPYNEHTGRFSHMLQRGNVVIQDPTTKQNITIEVAPRTLEARVRIPVFFSNMKFITRASVDSGRVTFGPKTVRPAAAVAA